jgi:hypothetical protein
MQPFFIMKKLGKGCFGRFGTHYGYFHYSIAVVFYGTCTHIFSFHLKVVQLILSSINFLSSHQTTVGLHTLKRQKGVISMMTVLF